MALYSQMAGHPVSREDFIRGVQVHGHARRVQGQAAQKLEPGKGQGLGEPGEGIVLQLRVYQRVRRQQCPVGHGGHIEAEQILPGNRFRVGGQMDAVHRGLLLPGEGPQQAIPVPPLRRVEMRRSCASALWTSDGRTTWRSSTPVMPPCAPRAPAAGGTGPAPRGSCGRCSAPPHCRRPPRRLCRPP